MCVVGPVAILWHTAHPMCVVGPVALRPMVVERGKVRTRWQNAPGKMPLAEAMAGADAVS